MATTAARGSNIVRRASFDIGSGMSKMQVSDVDLSKGRVVGTLFAEEREVLFAADWKASGERSELSEEIQARGLQVLRALRQIADELGATQIRGVATEVFRKASNGGRYLEQVAHQLGICANVITQAEEARLGWLTAVAALSSEEDASTVVAWDSGGGSFQVSARLASQEVRRRDLVHSITACPLISFVLEFRTVWTADRGGCCAGQIGCYNGAWGSTVATEALMTRIQHVDYTGGEASPNPVSVDQAQRLIAAIRETMEPPPRWLTALLHSDTGKVVAIGTERRCCQENLQQCLTGLETLYMLKTSQLTHCLV